MLNRANVAIVAKFRLKNSPFSELVVATTHLLYNPRRQDVRLAQVQVLLAEIDRVAYQGIDELRRTRYLPIILTGDFNFQPNTAPYCKLEIVFGSVSDLDRYATTHFSIDCKRLCGIQCAEQKIGNSTELRTEIR